MARTATRALTLSSLTPHRLTGFIRRAIYEPRQDVLLSATAKM